MVKPEVSISQGNDCLLTAMDISFPDDQNHVLEVQIKHDKSVVWININGQCVFRACRIPNLNVKDDSK